MMEFDGHLSGMSQKHFFRAARIFGQKCIFLSMLLITPVILRFSVRTKDWSVVVFFISAFICIMLLTLIPQSKKERKAITPKRIVIEAEYIVCVAEKYTETRLVKDVKMVKDFGEYYVLYFPFGKSSDKFICQKSLLKQGSIQEFEELFERKITKA